MKATKGILICVILLLASHKNYGAKIGVKMIDNFNVLYFENDSMIVYNQYFDLSPDSETCVLLDKEFNEFTMFNYQMDIIRKIKYDYSSANYVKVSNDQRYITYGNHAYSERPRTECVLKMYSNAGEIIKDTIVNPGLSAEFINNNDLVVLHATNKIGLRGSKEEIDTKLLIFDSKYELIIEKKINYYSMKFVRPHFNAEGNEYLFELIVNENGSMKKTTISIKK